MPLAQVRAEVEHNGRLYVGIGISQDVLEASAKAYVLCSWKSSFRPDEKGRKSMKKNIVCLPGDGIGTEVVASAVEVLEKNR